MFLNIVCIKKYFKKWLYFLNKGVLGTIKNIIPQHNIGKYYKLNVSL